MDTQSTQLTDLPELDSVTSGGRGLLVVSLIGLGIFSLFFGAAIAAVYALIRVIGQHADFSPMETLAVGLAGAVASALLMIRTNWFEYQWTIDSTGLTIKGISRARHIGWSQVTDAKAKVLIGDKVSCTLRTTAGKIVLGDPFGDRSSLIAASLYQHLRRYGKADESMLTAGSKTFWMPIPREVPGEMDWHNPKPPEWSVTLAITLLVLIAVPLIYYLGPRVDWGHAWNLLHNCAGAVIPLGYYKLRERIIAAHVVSVRHDGIEMRTARRMIYIPWREVAYVQWNQQHSVFTVGRSTYRDVAIIRYRREDPASATVILSIIRQLRAVHHAPPVVIPPPMRTMLIDNVEWQSSVLASTESVEARAAKPSVVAAGVFSVVFMAVMLVVLMTTKAFPPVAIAGLAILEALDAVFWIGQATTVYRANSEGLTVSSFGKRRLIRWHDVTSYTIVPIRGTNATKRILKGFSGRPLLMLALAEGIRADNDVFLAYLDAKLAPVRQSPTTLTR